MDPAKLQYLAQLKNQVATRNMYLGQKESLFQAKQKQLRSKNRSPLSGAMGDDFNPLAIPSSNPVAPGGDLMQMLQASLPPGLVPGNVGDINSVVWPFYFTTDQCEVGPNESFRTGFTITQEACFVWMSFTKAVFIKDENGDLSYIDPDSSAGSGNAFGLSVQVHDSQSNRDFQNSPTDLDNVGNPRWPTKYPRPSLFPPNANLEITFNNQDPAATYVPFLTAFGYRIRINDARTLLSFVTG